VEDVRFARVSRNFESFERAGMRSSAKNLGSGIWSCVEEDIAALLSLMDFG
jgi:hypothetical protein